MKRQVPYRSVFFSGCLILLSPSGAILADTHDAELTARGRYLVQVAGCNDCHSPGYMATEGQTPEELWLTGDAFGWRGPWGTTYATNLRLLLDKLTEDQFLALARNLRARPPMPWFGLNKMTDDDLRAIYRYARSLGPAGEPAPEYVPPGAEPKTPFALFPAPPEAEDPPARGAGT